MAGLWFTLTYTHEPIDIDDDAPGYRAKRVPTWLKPMPFTEDTDAEIKRVLRERRLIGMSPAPKAKRTTAGSRKATTPKRKAA